MKPYYRKDGICILNGHVLDILKKLPSESIQCVITSPPYWGLRDYGLEPQIWDADENCEHEWGNQETGFKNSSKGNKGSTTASNPNHEINDRFDSYHQHCLKCGAWKGSLGLEPTPELYVQHLVQIFHETKRVLRKDGTCWLNLGDSYAANRSYQVTDTKHIAVGNTKASRVPDGLKQKDLVGIPWRAAFALQSDGWYLRSDIIWEKPNCMPESVKDRPTRSHEYIFLLSKSRNYYYNSDAIKEEASLESVARYARGRSDHHKWADGGPGNQTCAKSLEHMKGNTLRNKRSVWHIPTQNFKDAHFATFPEEIPRMCISAGCPENGIVLDLFMGSGRTLIVAKRLKRRAIGIELNPEYCKMPVQALANEDG